MAPDGERPSRGRRRMAARRAGASAARRPGPTEATRPDPGWEEPFFRAEAPPDDLVTDPAPSVPPAEGDETGDPGDGTPMVIVATTPGVSAPRVTPPLAAAPRIAAPRAATPPAISPPAASSRAAAPSAPPSTVAPSAASAISGGPDPSSEFGRMFSRLLVRMGNVERRLDGFEGRLQATAGADGVAAAAPDPDHEAREAEREYDRQMLTWLADRVEALTAEMEEQRRDAASRTDAVDTAVGRIEALTAMVATLQAQVDDLAASRGERGQSQICSGHQLLVPTVAQLQRETAEAADRALAVEARMAQLETLPSVMEDLAGHQFQLLAAELPSAPVDIEAVYKELDSVAEVLAARDAAVARGLEKVGSLEDVVTRLQDDFVRIVDALAASRAAEDKAQERIGSLERRLEMLESPEQDVERLYTALDRARGAAPAAPAAEPDAVEAPAVEAPGIRVADGASAHRPHAASAGRRGSQSSQPRIQALAADLDRIRRSLEVLADEVPPTD